MLLSEIRRLAREETMNERVREGSFATRLLCVCVAVPPRETAGVKHKIPDGNHFTSFSLTTLVSRWPKGVF